MNNQWFEERKKCPACEAENFKILYTADYDKGPIKEYLDDFYSEQGIIEYDYLKGAQYVLCECLSCGLIFQKDIPNAFLMDRLYDHWLDPK